MDRNVGVRARKGAHPFRCGDKADVFDPFRAPLLQDVDGLGRRAAGREHGVQHETNLNGRRRWELVVVRDRPERALVTEEPDVPDLRLRHELERRFDHADPRAQYRDETDLHGEARTGVRRERCLDLTRLRREVGGRLVEEECGDLPDELAEDLRRCALVAKPRDLLSDQRVRRDMELGAQRATFSGVIPGTGKRRVRSRTSAATSFATVSSPFACRIRPMSAPMRSISASFIPRVVTAGVPMRMPDAIPGFWGSYGMVFLFTVIPTASSAFSACLPVRFSGRTSTSIRWLSVPPDTMRRPAFASDAASVRAFTRICFAYALNSGVAASFSITALPAITCMSGPPWTFGNTALSIAFA